MLTFSCFRYHKGTDFQANHNKCLLKHIIKLVVLDTTKVQIFKQITTTMGPLIPALVLFQIPQRYRFSSKSQRRFLFSGKDYRCFRYHKGTDFQANHNLIYLPLIRQVVVLDTTKVQIFKQITTTAGTHITPISLFQIPQRYRFSSKSQRLRNNTELIAGCFRYHKGTDFQANHNLVENLFSIYKLFQIPQRYRFSSKSQLIESYAFDGRSCFRYHKGTDFQANHNM